MAETSQELLKNVQEPAEKTQEFSNTPEHFRVKLEVGGYVEYRQVGTNLDPSELDGDLEMDRALRLQVLPWRYGIKLENGNVNVYEAMEMVCYDGASINDADENVEENDIGDQYGQEAYEAEMGYGGDANYEGDAEEPVYNGYYGYYGGYYDGNDDESHFDVVNEENYEGDAEEPVYNSYYGYYGGYYDGNDDESHFDVVNEEAETMDDTVSSTVPHL